jgi:SNF2 family DNA or RNA helicase
MADLQPAGFLESLLSFFSPKRLTVQVRTAVLMDGNLCLTPVFLIDGKEVPSEQVTFDGTQKVLGRYVLLDGRAKQVLDLTKGKAIKLAKSKAAGLLKDLSGRGVPVRCRDGKASFQLKTAKPDVSLELAPDDSLRVTSRLVTEEGKIIGKPNDVDALRTDDGWHADGEDLIKVEITNTPLDRVLLQDSGNGPLEGGEVPLFLKALQANASSIGEVEKNEALDKLTVTPASGSNRVNVTGDEEHISLEPKLTLRTPDGSSYTYAESEIPALENAPGGFARVREGWLDVDATAISGFQAANSRLRDRTRGQKEIRGTDIPKILSILQQPAESGEWRQSPWNVYHSKAVTEFHQLVPQHSSLEFQLNIVESDGKALLHLDPIYSHARFRLSHTEVERATTEGEDWVRKPRAWVRIDQDRYDRVSKQAKELELERSGDGYAFPAADRERVLPLFAKLGAVRQSPAYADFLAKLHDFERIEEVPLPPNCSSVRLRPYQQHGFNWLAFLQKFSLNGILADDMGLGKTVQTLAAIERAREVTRSRLPALIICPTSVMLNWRSEIHKFLHDSEVVVYHGNLRRDSLERIHETVGPRNRSARSCYVVTSYDTARIDCEILNRVPWLYVVVDEGHNIKNPDAQRTRAIKTIAGQHKLALTGTPIQNKLEELWSLFDFAMPGYLGARTEFRRTYATSNRVDWSAVERQLVPKIRPFVLRRLKKQVAQDLPEKLVLDHRAELTPRQAALYKQAIHSREYKKLVEELDSKGVARSAAHIFAVLTKLRNICNHPILLNEHWQSADATVEESGKLDLLRELLEEIVEGEHRALLFSQSTRVLDIIEHHFQDWGIQSLRIDGQTAALQRARIADEFNSNTSVHCLLLSTKAASTGLNLVGADTVIFYDHDWNPANDSQAMDRAYRIGQTRDVTVYRLISKGTIEEKILERQKTKQSLAEEVIGIDEHGFKDLSKEQLLDLFRLEND